MANEYLQRTNTSVANKKVFTYSFWMKGNDITASSQAKPIYNYDGGSGLFQFFIERSSNTNPGYWVLYGAGSVNIRWEGTRIDPAAWYHIVLSINTTRTQSEDRAILYINGVRTNVLGSQGGSPGTPGFPALNAEQYLGANYINGIASNNRYQLSDFYYVDGQALTSDVFGFYKEGKGYVSAGSTQATDFRPGQWVPKAPRTIKSEINRRGGFGVNGFYLPMNDSSNFGADFHCAPNSIIKLKGEDLPQPRNGAPTTTDAYVSQLRSDPYAANLVLAVPGISTSTSANLVTNGTFETVVDGETGYDNGDGTVDGWNKNSIGSLSITSGTTGRALRVSQPSATAGVTYGQGSISLGTLTSGKRYLLKYSGLGGTAKKYPAICTNANTSNTDGSFLGLVAQIGAYSTAAEEVQKYFEPSSTAEHWLVLQLGDDGAGTYHDFDNIVVIQEDAPRDYSADIKGSGTNKTLTAYGNAGVGYEIPSYYGSALSFDGTGDAMRAESNADFNLGDGDYTIEGWFYRDIADTNVGSHCLWAIGGVNNEGTLTLFYENGGYLMLRGRSPGDGTYTNIIYVISHNHPIQQWAHICTERHNSVTTVYLNGVAIETDISDSKTVSQGYFAIGAFDTAGSYSFDGYIQDLRVYKGVAKYKGGFDVPKPYSPIGIESWRAVPDCTTNNFATLNPLQTSVNNNDPGDFSDGNLTVTYDTSTNHGTTMCNFPLRPNGNWYAEARVGSLTESGGFSLNIGVTGHGDSNTSAAISFNEVGTGYRADGGEKRVNVTGSGGGVESSYGDSYGVGDIIGVHYNAGTLIFYKNGVSQGVASSNMNNLIGTLTGDLFFGCGDLAGPAGGSFTWNFGQNPSFSGTATAGTYADANGKGLFKYQPPSGALALCEDNLPTPAIADPGENFKTVLYTGTGASRSVVGVGFTPDLVWMKGRNFSIDHGLFDTVRGAVRHLRSSGTATEGILTDELTSFDSDGFSLGASGNWISNRSGYNYVAWCWKAGGSSNTFNVDGTGYATASAAGITDGSIALTGASVNTTAGFSIVSYTSPNNASDQTVGHGLNKKPDFIIVKDRDFTYNWDIYHSSLGYNNSLIFTTAGTRSGAFGAEPTSSVFTTKTTYTHNSTDRYIAYCWHSVENFSKFGIYSTNSSADGPFVYLGFKPAFLLVKPTYVSNWIIMDSSRGPTNPDLGWLYPDLSANEESASSRYCDFLSNGFKVRNGGTGMNNGGSVIYAAFAESPFQTANAK